MFWFAPKWNKKSVVWVILATLIGIIGTLPVGAQVKVRNLIRQRTNRKAPAPPLRIVVKRYATKSLSQSGKSGTRASRPRRGIVSSYRRVVRLRRPYNISRQALSAWETASNTADTDALLDLRTKVRLPNMKAAMTSDYLPESKPMQVSTVNAFIPTTSGPNAVAPNTQPLGTPRKP